MRSRNILTFLGLLLSMCIITGCNTTKTQSAVESTANENTNASSLESTLCSTPLTALHIPAGDVLALAQQKDVEPYQFTTSHNADIIPVDNNTSYAVWWQPDGFNPTTDTVIVSLHGHGDWAVKDFEVWYPELQSHKYAYLGLQWWFGRSLESNGYYDDAHINAIIQNILKEKNITPGNVIFQGFSMGGARSYAATLYDSVCGNHYYGVSIANAGPWEDDYPSYSRIIAGDYGTSPFAGTQWILFCGDKDENEYAHDDRTHVCDGMRYTKDILTQYGGTVLDLIIDPNGDHGSFMRTQSNVEQGLKEAAAALKITIQ